MKHYIEVNGQKLRVLFNWNALGEFAELYNLPIVDLEDISKFTPKMWRDFVFAALREGAKEDGYELKFDSEGLGKHMNMQMYGQLTRVYVAQNMGPEALRKYEKSVEEFEKNEGKKMQQKKS